MNRAADLPPSAIYPEHGRAAWIVAQREGASGPVSPVEAASRAGVRTRVIRPTDVNRPQGVFLERERLISGEIVDSGVILLTNKECPWRCLMCDLWKETTTQSVPIGAIPRQLDFAKERLAALRVPPTASSRQGRMALPDTDARAGDSSTDHANTEADPVLRDAASPKSGWPNQLKLYNSGSFFDPAAIPPEDFPPIARQVASVRNVVVESHPRLIGDSTLRWRDLREGQGVEVAMGLETAHPGVLDRLNKHFDLEQFARAADFLRSAGCALRVFLLVKPPFLAEEEAVEWAVKSAMFAFDCGATAVSLIATRAGNGALERLRDHGEFTEPRLTTLEAAQAKALALKRGRVFADTWGAERFSACAHCWPIRRARIENMNLTQQLLPPVVCPSCHGR